MQILPKFIKNFLVSSLRDASISAPATGQSLIWNGSAWQNQNNVIDHWNATTQFTSGSRVYTNKANSDANGRVTLFLTTTGLVGGAALFTVINSIHASALLSTGAATSAPLCYVESISVDLKTLVVRAITAGIGTAFAGTGIPYYVTVVGRR